MMEGYLVATSLKNLMVRDVKVSNGHQIKTYFVAIKICFLMFLLSILFVGFPPSPFFSPNFNDEPYNFMFKNDGRFDGGHVLDESDEFTFKDSSNWDKLGSYFDFGGNRRIIIQLLGQLDGIELHSR